MPHGLTIDADGNVWITDVALHQVFKFGPKGQMLLLTLGVKFVPGHKGGHFCKPTSVAVLDNGDFFVADGYCNSRIIKYTRAGVKMFQWGSSDFNGNLILCKIFHKINRFVFQEFLLYIQHIIHFLCHMLWR